MSAEFEVTKAAALKAKELIVEEGNSNLMLRVAVVVSATSSDFNYRFTFDKVVQDGDTEVVKEDVRFLVDPMSFQYLAGSEIDYTEGLEGSQFVIQNPNDDVPPPAVSNAMRHG